MLKKIVRLSFLTLLMLALTTTQAGDRKVVTLRVFPDSTVGDIFRTTRKGFTGFTFPTAPEFTSRWFWQSVPRGMKSYPALYKTAAGKITTGAMIRFIKQSHTLFADPLLRKCYEAALSSCVDAHKTWFKNKTPENLTKLHENSEKVLKLLDTLALSNPITRHLLQRMLSTPKTGKITQAWDWLMLGKRSSVQAQFGKTTDKIKVAVCPNQSWKITSIITQSMKCTGLMIASIFFICPTFFLLSRTSAVTLRRAAEPDSRCHVGSVPLAIEYVQPPDTLA